MRSFPSPASPSATLRETGARDLPRRAFLRRGAAVAVGAALAVPRPAGAQESGRKLRVAIVGGRFGRTFQFHEHPDCVVEAVSDLREERRAALQKTYRCPKAYPSLTDLLRDPKVEAVFLATPAPDHVPHTLQALAAGKHVLSAVPAAMTIEECGQLVDAVKRSGLTYMMAETSYWQQLTISARKFHREGAFGRLFHVESEYHHPGLEELYFEDGQRTWRHGLPPMHYPTHCTAHLVGVTGERLTEVTCHGWGDDDPILRDNVYRNPFWNETALFRTNRGNSMRVAVWWRGAQTGGERARFFGDKLSLYFGGPNGAPPCLVKTEAQPRRGKRLRRVCAHAQRRRAAGRGEMVGDGPVAGAAAARQRARRLAYVHHARVRRRGAAPTHASGRCVRGGGLHRPGHCRAPVGPAGRGGADRAFVRSALKPPAAPARGTFSRRGEGPARSPAARRTAGRP
jgi:predicted dehydrogenase